MATAIEQQKRQKRLLALLQRNFQKRPASPTPLTARELSAKMGSDLSERTVQRIMQQLKDAGYDIHSSRNPSSPGYYLKSGVKEINRVKLSDKELVSVAIARQLIGIFRESPMEKQFDRILKRIVEGIDDASLKPYRLLCSFKTTGHESTDWEKLLCIASAIQNHCFLDFYYQGNRDTIPRKRQARPAHLQWMDGKWYLLATDEQGEESRVFVLQRMHDVSASNERFIPFTDDEIERYRDRPSLGIRYGDTSAYTARIRLSGWAVRHAMEKQWFVDETICEQPDGSVIYEMRLTDYNEIERWVWSWGQCAQVLAPEELVKRHKEMAAAIDAQYANGK